MLYFKKEKKKELLQGRKIEYLTETKIIPCSKIHLGNILNGKSSCSLSLARNIVELISNEAKVEDYFMEK